MKYRVNILINRVQLFVYFFISLSTICYGQRESLADPIRFQLNLNNLSHDCFKVTVETGKLKSANDLFQFASTAPGAYQTMNIGRFVHDFKAFDKKGKEIKTERISVNQFRLSKPKRVRTITYEVFDTWDFKVEENPVYMMCGTSLEQDHAYINSHAVFGYLQGMQSRDISIRLNYPSDWKIGTALQLDENGNYRASSFDHMADSPFLLGRLSHASITIDSTLVDVYTYSKTDKITSNQILASLEGMLKASAKFMEGLPVDHYTFLYHFEDIPQGAWEHSYSSSYVLFEDDWSNVEDIVKPVSSHEFFHIVTPLNIHSEIIEHFNFITPTSSDHLWLYEGVTEWAANYLLYRDGQLSTAEYLGILHLKAENSDLYFDNEISLVELARTSFTAEGQKNYSNIYNKGALVAELLNVKLLELSNGERGLREVMIALTQQYGPDVPFNESEFFNDFVKNTYPEISEFLSNYVMGTTELPFKEYFDKIGVDYIESESSKTQSAFPYDLDFAEQVLVVKSVTNEGLSSGIQIGDTLLSLNGQEINIGSLYKIYQDYIKKEPGTRLELVVRRGQKELTISTQMLEKEDLHILLLNPNPSPAQLALREKWNGRLK